MRYLRINGGRPLQGTVELAGAKNSVLPMMAAALLCDAEVCLENVPALSDVRAGAAILESLGRGCELVGRRMVISPGQLTGQGPSRQQMETMRSSVAYLAPMLVRQGRAVIYHPGGCNLGPRPIDMHLHGLAAMGAVYEKQGDCYCLTAPNGLHGADMTLRLPSVGTTETLLMAAVLARGPTTLRNAAREPEITDLAGMLNACGAHIEGAGTTTIHVTPVPALTGGSWRVAPDRILASTVLCALASVGGSVAIDGAEISMARRLIVLLREAGCEIEQGPRGLLARCEGGLRGAHIASTAPFPGLATDAGPLLCSAFCRGPGRLELTETVFDDRYACARGLRLLGADIEAEGRRVTVRGRAALSGAEVTAPDLRGGAGLAIAALAAKGETRMGGLSHIERGYEDLAATFSALGARADYVKA